MEHYVQWENDLNQRQSHLDDKEDTLSKQQTQIALLQKRLQDQALRFKHIEQQQKRTRMDLDRKSKLLDGAEQELKDQRQELHSLQEVTWAQSIVMAIRNNPLQEAQPEQWCDGRYWAEHLDNGQRVLWAQNTSSKHPQNRSDKRAILYRCSDGTISPGQHLQQQDALLFQQWAEQQSGLTVQPRHKLSTLDQTQR
jgi:E3 ubiquitin-protein ligase DOA10